jgi:hypothetical protein
LGSERGSPERDRCENGNYAVQHYGSLSSGGRQLERMG